MSNSIVSIIKSYQGKNIRINPNDNYVCLTDMAAVVNKKVNDWHRLNATAEYLKAFEAVAGIPVSVLLTVEHGNTSWAHPKIAIRFAQWCSPEFAIQVDFWIDELLSTGLVSIAKVSEPRLLIEDSKKVAQSVADIEAILGRTNPRLAQLLIDVGVNHFVESTQPQLPASSEFPDDKWYGIVQIADKIGIKTNASTRVKLGNFVGKKGLERVRESRLCNGLMTEIWCYRDDELTRNAIEQFAQNN